MQKNVIMKYINGENNGCPRYCLYTRTLVEDILNQVQKETSKRWLLKVRYWDRLAVYDVTTDDIFHVIGKLYCTSEKIERVDYSEWTKEREYFWLMEGFDIKPLSGE